MSMMLGLTVAWILCAPITASASSVLDQVVGSGARNEIISAEVPLRPDGVLRLLPAVARATGVPMGLEVVRGGELIDDESAASDGQEIEDSRPLTGLTLRAALELLVMLDPRYEWREMRGVLVVRPVQSWGARGHVLDRVVSIQTRQFWLESALHSAVTAIEPRLESPPPPPQSNRRFFLTLQLTALETLNALARGYGSLIWIFRPYGRPMFKHRHMDLELRPLDGELPASASWLMQ